jgi:hypothetical protein
MVGTGVAVGLGTGVAVGLGITGALSPACPIKPPAAMPTITTPVAIQSHARRRRPARGGVGVRSSIQRVPFQNMIRLRSATRLTLRAPWLCGPASRRVCYFVEVSWKNAPRYTPGDI